MGVWEVTEYFASCDECTWSDGPFSDREAAEGYLGEHTEEKH